VVRARHRGRGSAGDATGTNSAARPEKQIEALTDHANRSRDFARDAHDLLRIEMRLPAGAVKAFWYLQQELPNDRCDCGGSHDAKEKAAAHADS
jgi:hypothetical protein